MINTRRVVNDLQKAFITFGNGYYPNQIDLCLNQSEISNLPQIDRGN